MVILLRHYVKITSKWPALAPVEASNHRDDDVRSQGRPTRAISRSSTLHEPNNEGETNEFEGKERHGPALANTFDTFLEGHAITKSEAIVDIQSR